MPSEVEVPEEAVTRIAEQLGISKSGAKWAIDQTALAIRSQERQRVREALEKLPRYHGDCVIFADVLDSLGGGPDG